MADGIVAEIFRYRHDVKFRSDVDAGRMGADRRKILIDGFVAHDGLPFQNGAMWAVNKDIAGMNT